VGSGSESADLVRGIPLRSVADPHHFDADPDPAFHFDAVPDPDPDPTVN